MDLFLQQLLNGLVLGSIYALTALGYTLVYGILLMINFAHSEIFMAGAYAGWLALAGLKQLSFLNQPNPWALPAVLAICFLISGLLGLAMERMAYRPLRLAPRLSPLISAIGLSLFLQNLAMLIFGPQSIVLPDAGVRLEQKFIALGPVIRLSGLQVLILSAAVLLMALLRLFVNKTKLGRAMRATAQDRQAAELMGINTNRVIALCFFIGAGLGGIAGMLNGIYYGSIRYNMGFIPGIKAFSAAVLGGIGNIGGAMLGGYILGVIEALASGYLSSQYKDVFAFIILILVLIFRPSGILGRHIPEKV